MRFVHMADIHLDSTFSNLASVLDLCDIRRLEQKQIFKKVIEYVKENNIPFLFIAGDLYEQNYIREETILYIDNLFKTIPDTKIFISPGNHDPFIKNSYYNTFNWSNNVYIFNSEIGKYEFDNIDIYGFGFNDFYCNNSKIEKINIGNKNKLNVLISHVDLNASKTLHNPYNPIASSELSSIGFDYCALGHIHKADYCNKEHIVFPGSTISFGFDELGKHGILDVTLDKEHCNINFIEMDNRIFEEYYFDISEIVSEEELIQKINELVLDTNNLYKLILTGNKNFEINLLKINKFILIKNIIKIKDFSKYKIDLDNISKQNNLKGFFVRELLSKNISELYSQEEIEKAIEIGLEVL